MKDLMKHLPLTLSVLTFVLVGLMWFDVGPSSECKGSAMRDRMAQGMMKKRMSQGSDWGKGKMRREEGKRGPKKEDK